MPPRFGPVLGLIALLLFVAAHPAGATTALPKVQSLHPTTVKLVGVHGSIGFDDIRYLSQLQRIVVPAGRTGKLVLINPANGRQRVIPVLKAVTAHPGSGDLGTTSVAYADGYFIASDHQDQQLVVANARTGAVVDRVPLAAGPDYVRNVAPLHEIWVSEPRAAQIQRFAIHTGPHTLTLSPAGVVAVPKGPESLVIDAANNRAYTNQWRGKTVAINLRSGRIVAQYANTCHGASGLALAAKRGLLFVGCKEGRVVALDLDHQGKIVASAPTGRGVDIIAWNPVLAQLAVPAWGSANLTVLGLGADDHLTVLARGPAEHGSHCVAVAPTTGAIYVCDPHQGTLLRYHIRS